MWIVFIIGVAVFIAGLIDTSKEKPGRALALTAIGLLVFVLSSIKADMDAKKLQYESDSGRLSPAPTNKMELVWKVNGVPIIFPDGVFKVNELMPELPDIKSRQKATEPPFKDVNFSATLENGKIVVNTIIRDTSGNISAEIVDNEWQVGTDIYDKNFSENAFEVRNKAGEVILQIEIVGNEVKMQGFFVLPDGSLACFTGIPDANIMFAQVYNPGSYKVITQSRSRAIKPIFKYPSKLHPGERAK